MADFSFPTLTQRTPDDPASTSLFNPLLATATVSHAKPAIGNADASPQGTGPLGSPLPRPIRVADPVQPQAAARTRNKVPLEKGYSQVAWLRLSAASKDLTGLKGKAVKGKISMQEVQRHNTEADGWVVLRGKVYNISPYLKYHPGGVQILADTAGTDCTELFNKYHAWVNGEALLAKCFIGLLEQQ